MPRASRRGWIVFSVVFLSSLVAPFNQYKVPPLIPVLLPELRLSELQAGLLMSVFSLSGLVLSFPAGVILRRFGPGLVGSLAIAATGLGSAVGALAADTTTLLVGRLLEGVGMGIVAVLAVVTIAAWFPVGRRGVPMAIFTTWIPLGQLLIFIIAPRVYEAWGWRAVWWVGAAVAFVCAALFALVVRLPREPRMGQLAGSTPPLSRILHEPGPWLLAAFFSTFHIARTAFGTWTPTYLVNSLHWSLTDAASLVSLFYIVSLPAAVPAGWLIDRLGSGSRAYLLATVASLPAFAVAYAVDPTWLVVAMLWTGAAAAVIPGAVNAMTPETVSDRSLVGPAAGVVSVGRNGGQLLAPILVAPIVQAGLSWNWVSALIVGVSAAGLLAGARVKEGSGP